MQDDVQPAQFTSFVAQSVPTNAAVTPPPTVVTHQPSPFRESHDACGSTEEAQSGGLQEVPNKEVLHVYEKKGKGKTTKDSEGLLASQLEELYGEGFNLDSAVNMMAEDVQVGDDNDVIFADAPRPETQADRTVRVKIASKYCASPYINPWATESAILSQKKKEYIVFKKAKKSVAL